MVFPHYSSNWSLYRNTLPAKNSWEPFPSSPAIWSRPQDQTAASSRTSRKPTPKVSPRPALTRSHCCWTFFIFFLRAAFIKRFSPFAPGSLPKVVVNAATKMLAPKVCEANTSVVINSFNRAFCLHLQSSAAFESDELKNTQTISVGRVCIHEAI